MTKERRVEKLKKAIEEACVRNKLNLTVHENKIGFVDQEERKIIALWTPVHSLEKAD